MNKTIANTDHSWNADGDNYSPKVIKEFLYENRQIKEFLSNSEKRFVVGGKGLGKTLLLKRKRYILESENTTGIIFIPSNQRYLDSGSDDFKNIDSSTMKLLSNIENSKRFWNAALTFSVLSYEYSIGLITKNMIDSLPIWMQDLIMTIRNPTEVLLDLVIPNHCSLSDLQNDLRKYFRVANRLFARINHAYNIFIDGMDQKIFKDLSTSESRRIFRDFWIKLQAGLLEASFDINKHNTHIKIYCSIRYEAYINHASHLRSQLSTDTVNLIYSKDEILEIINNHCLFVENQKLADVLGRTAFVHPKTQMRENIENYLIRHSLYRPRDLIVLMDKLPKNKKFDTSEFRKGVNNTAAVEIGQSIFDENKTFLNHLVNIKNRESFFTLIPHNILSKKDMLEVCGTFNNTSNCTFEKCAINKGQCKRPFNELYDLGLLGIIDKDNKRTKKSRKQEFKMPNEIGIFNDNDIPKHTNYYLIHPVLNDLVKVHKPGGTESETGYIIPYIKVGHGETWEDFDDSAFNLFTALNKVEDKSLFEEVYKKIQDLNKSQLKLIIKELILELDKKKSSSTNAKEFKEIVNAVLERFDLIVLNN